MTKIILYSGYFIVGSSIILSANIYYNAILNEEYEQIKKVVCFLLPSIAGFAMIFAAKIYSIVKRYKDKKRSES